MKRRSFITGIIRTLAAAASVLRLPAARRFRECPYCGERDALERGARGVHRDSVLCHTCGGIYLVNGTPDPPYCGELLAQIRSVQRYLRTFPASSRNVDNAAYRDACIISGDLHEALWKEQARRRRFLDSLGDRRKRKAA